MCNAHNHHPGCNCGWGGGFSGGGLWRYRASTYSVASQLPVWLKSVTTQIDSYTTPNARCPVCGDNVFFYQSPYGGRVYFDELGPPWPKHPCTDKRTIPDPPMMPESAPVYLWQRQGWKPFEVNAILAEVAGLPSLYFTVVKGLSQGVPITVHVIERSFYERIHEDVSLIFAHAKFESQHEVALSFLDNENVEFKVRGFYSLSQARQEYDNCQAGKLKNSRSRENETSLRRALVKALGKIGGREEKT